MTAPVWNSINHHVCFCFPILRSLIELLWKRFISLTFFLTHTQSTEERMVPVNVSFQSHPYFCHTFNQEVAVLFGFHETFLVNFSIFPGGLWEKVVLLDL
jgi:hypothetical protein